MLKENLTTFIIVVFGIIGWESAGYLVSKQENKFEQLLELATELDADITINIDSISEMPPNYVYIEHENDTLNFRFFEIMKGNESMGTVYMEK